MTGKKPKARKARKLTDEHITSLREFEFRGLVPDSVVQGLFIYLGVHRTSWIYKKWARVKGKLKSREKTIGHWPALSTPAARIEALKEAATFASGAAVVSKKDATTFATAFVRQALDEEGDRQRQARPLALQCREVGQDHAPDVRALDAR